MKHRRRNYRARHAVRRRRAAVPAVALTAAALAASASAVLLPALDHPHPIPHPEAAPLAGLDLDRTADLRASRDLDRPMPTALPPSATAASTSPAPPPAPAQPPAPPPPPAHPRPVAGLTQAQMDNAATIVQVAHQRNLPRRAMVIGIVTALQESDLYNQASSAVPASFQYPHQGSSADHDSVGLFQQRPSQGWGTVAQCMDPAYSAGRFFSALVQVPGWQYLDVAAAAQAVQKSAFPSAYAKHETQAQQIVAALGY